MVVVRAFCDGDESTLVEILKLNHRYGSPGVDGPEAMRRIARCPAAEFLVAEEGESAVGFVRGVYDGSRALIHQLSVHPRHQSRGIGSRLVREICRVFSERGAPTLSATVTSNSVAFWEKIGFQRLEVFLVLADSNRLLDAGQSRDQQGGAISEVLPQHVPVEVWLHELQELTARPFETGNLTRTLTRA